ncbi:MAG: aminotransferase class I/II-fold pyridoxal phosphate-dependent enzyme, partial [Gemmatimonadetes bacterium]|nr:aminotransferase class I/II-fold pyridoxal phosphate-dependent enzyme [Gemmatimonadota bacterium]
DGKLDLGAMEAAARGAGLIFLCNPNNPTSTVHTGSDVRAFARTVRRNSPNTVIHFDEAYHEYVTHPDYEPALELALETPKVFVTRTFSKLFGMAGMRIGYGVGHRDTIVTLRRYSLTVNTNVPGLAAAYAAVRETDFVRTEHRRNTEAKQFTVDFLAGRGLNATTLRRTSSSWSWAGRQRISGPLVGSTAYRWAATSRRWSGLTPGSASERWTR